MKKPDQKPELFLPATLNVMGGLQWRIQERGPGGPAPPYFYTKLTKIFFWDQAPPALSQGLDDCPPPPLSEGLDPPQVSFLILT